MGRVFPYTEQTFVCVCVCVCVFPGQLSLKAEFFYGPGWCKGLSEYPHPAWAVSTEICLLFLKPLSPEAVRPQSWQRSRGSLELQNTRHLVSASVFGLWTWLWVSVKPILLLPALPSICILRSVWSTAFPTELPWHATCPAHCFPSSPVGKASPAMFPRAHTACSHTVMWGEDRSSTRGWMAPPSTTARVSSEAPEAMLVRAQAASNCKRGWRDDLRSSTSLGMSPASTISFRGGFFSRDSIFLCSVREKKDKNISCESGREKPLLWMFLAFLTIQWDKRLGQSSFGSSHSACGTLRGWRSIFSYYLWASISVETNLNEAIHLWQHLHILSCSQGQCRGAIASHFWMDSLFPTSCGCSTTVKRPKRPVEFS